MVKNLYQKYFAPDKMLRHIFQHVEIACVGWIVLYTLTKLPLTWPNVAIFLAFSFAPDLDGISSVFIWARKIPMAKETVRLLSQFKLKEALSYATVHHKQLNKLTFHNLVAYPIMWAIFVLSVISKNYSLSLPLASLLSHFTFDWIDDLYQMGHLKNWLWPYNVIFPKAKIFAPNATGNLNPWKEYIPKRVRGLLLIS